MNPLAVEIWLSMLGAYVMVSLTIWIVARFSPYEWVEPTPCPSCKCPLQVGSRRVVLIDRAIEFSMTRWKGVVNGSIVSIFFKLLGKSSFQVFLKILNEKKKLYPIFAIVSNYRHRDIIENVWKLWKIHDPWTRIVNNWASCIRIACVIVLEISHHLAGVPMWSGWSRERVGSWQRRHSSAEDGQRVHPGQQLLVYGRHAYATGQRPQPQGKRVITESGSQLLKQVMRFEVYNVWKLVGHLSQLYVCVGKNVYRKNFTIFTQERFMIISKIKEWKYSKWLIVKIWRDEYIFFLLHRFTWLIL